MPSKSWAFALVRPPKNDTFCELYLITDGGAIGISEAKARKAFGDDKTNYLLEVGKDKAAQVSFDYKQLKDFIHNKG